MSYFVTGDTHGRFETIDHFVRFHGTSLSDVLIILGDAGINLCLNHRDRMLKTMLSEWNITFFCVHGNHEERPFHIETYVEKEWHEGIVYYEPEFPNILFAKDGEIYDFDGQKAIVIGGAYSVDKEYRLLTGLPWFPDEQPSQDIKAYVEKKLDAVNWKVDYVFSHTAPLLYEPKELFLDFIDQKKVDKSTEKWLSEIEKQLTYHTWYFGHYHGNRTLGRSKMLYEEIQELGKDGFVQRVGRPLYKVGDRVLFYMDDEGEEFECYGEIQVVDVMGSFFTPNEVSYDIYGADHRCPDNKVLYKHIVESKVEGTI